MNDICMKANPRRMPSMYSFGPVPSRRLGRSLGVNNVPSKTCTYACVYCQVGRTTKMTIEREAFYPIADILDDVDRRIKEIEEAGESMDYITIVPNGEPTLDLGLGRLVEGLKGTGHRVAVITNGSLLWMEGVREDLKGCDLVSMKVDAGLEQAWKAVDRPHPRLSFQEVLRGERDMAKEFDGTLITETMLVSGMNDSDRDLAAIADHIAGMEVEKAYISVPIRPPAVKTVELPSSERVLACYTAFKERSIDVELNIVGEEGDISTTGDLAADILRTTSVHPIRDDQMKRMTSADGGDETLRRLIDEGKVQELRYQGKLFYLRRR
jgi:wyosine [tRNA(Phe)-imidazoG37] synthetase (radical SAM superfamily)